MHDINDLDRRGIPGGFVASTEFIEAAELQSTALGFRPAAVFVKHPIQGRTDAEVQALADEAFGEVLRMICSAGASSDS